MSEQENRHYVGETVDIEPGDRIIVDVKGREIAVFNVGGEYYALANYCTHQGGPACEGLISGALTADEDFELTYSHEDEIISCPWHGWEFEIKTGEHLSQTGYKIPTYDVLLEDKEIYVEM